MLVQHSFIKDNDIHVKIGGDHGDDSFKLSYQIANLSHPNSTDNTVVFSIFEAKDYRSNIKIRLTRFNKRSSNNEMVVSHGIYLACIPRGQKLSYI